MNVIIPPYIYIYMYIIWYDQTAIRLIKKKEKNGKEGKRARLKMNFSL